MRPEQTANTISTDSVALYDACRSDQPSLQAAAYEVLWRYLYSVALQVVNDQPDAEALAEDCAQEAIIRVHSRLAECREPRAFRTWARRIVSHLAIDKLRRRWRQRRLDEGNDEAHTLHLSSKSPSLIETAVLEKMELNELRDVLNQAPISDRSRRVVIGRYLDDLPDEVLAKTESTLADQTVQPSHIQVTRAKNINKLRQWERLHVLFGRAT